MFELIFGIVVGVVAVGVSIYQAVKDSQDAKAAARIKKQVREKAKVLTNKIMKNSAVRDKLVMAYQEKGMGEARAYLMQSPFGSNIKTIQQQLQKTIQEFKDANDALTKEEQDLQAKQQALDRIGNDTYNTEGAKDAQKELNSTKWDNSTKASDAILNHLSNVNKPLTPKPTTTEPTQQVQGGLKGNNINVKV